MFDLIVFSVNQKKYSEEIPNNQNIFINCNNERYYGLWKFITSANGKWYDLTKYENEVGGTSLCNHIQKEFKSHIHWIDGEKLDCITPFRIDSAYQDSFVAILKHLLSASPVKMLYVLARYQSLEKEVVIGSLTIDEYMKLMSKEKIYANICYILSDNYI